MEQRGCRDADRLLLLLDLSGISALQQRHRYPDISVRATVMLLACLLHRAESPHSLLYSNRLSGTIPYSLGSLTSLNFLYVCCAAPPLLSLRADPSSSPSTQLAQCQPAQWSNSCIAWQLDKSVGLVRASLSHDAEPCHVLNDNARSDLSVEQLSGTIPATLGSLTSLTALCVRPCGCYSRSALSQLAPCST